ncbi:unnamed protein product [Auanema sp. JU1783]|nr:unnamed protein product [Auanema sp. JU1783]
MSNVNDWYSHFLAKRSIPLKREVPLNSPTEGFALSLTKLHITKLHPESKYRINAYFYDSKTTQLFGCPFYSQWEQPVHHECTFDEMVFFHCPRVDDNIMLVLEVVEDSNILNNESTTIAWGTIPVLISNEPIPTFGKTPQGIPHKRLHLHPGSPKVLMFVSKLETETATSGTLDFLLYSHPKLSDAFDFFPDFCIVGQNDEIPGLRRSGDTIALANPTPLPLVPASLDDIGLSFGPYADRLEQMILEEVNTERIYLENSTDKEKADPMCVLERRLRIGVHNGYTFLFEPMMVHLSSLDEQIMGSHSLRRKGRPLSRSSTDLKTELNTLFVRSKVSIPSLHEDSRMTLVFALDYLLGVRTKNNNISSHTQSMIICWGAWRPFANPVLVAEGGRIQASVSLIGGSRPNPEESLCFKNLIHLFRRDDSALVESAPKIFIKFTFSLLDMIPHVGPSSRLALSTESLISTPHQRIPSPVPHHEQMMEDTMEDENNEMEIVSAKVVKPTPLSQEKLPSILVKKPAIRTTSDFSKSMEKAFDVDEIQEPSPRDNVPSVYEIPWRESKTANMSRAVMSSLANEKFAPILDRNGDAPSLVDIHAVSSSNNAIEENDRLDTNEIILQFLSYKCLNRPDAVQPRRIFFTVNFYRFAEITSEELLITDSAHNGPNVLRRLSENSDYSENEWPPGFSIKYIIDRQSSKLSSFDEFLTYLRSESLVIDIWDSQSLILQGTARIPLRSLLRAGKEAVQSMVQCPVVCSAVSDHKSTMAVLFLKMANIGHPSSNQIGLFIL